MHHKIIRRCSSSGFVFVYKQVKKFVLQKSLIFVLMLTFRVTFCLSADNRLHLEQRQKRLESPSNLYISILPTQREDNLRIQFHFYYNRIFIYRQTKILFFQRVVPWGSEEYYSKHIPIIEFVNPSQNIENLAQILKTFPKIV